MGCDNQDSKFLGLGSKHASESSRIRRCPVLGLSRTLIRTLMDIYRDAPASTRPRIILNNTTPFTPSLIKGRLSAASNPEQIYANRIKGRQILLENPPRASKSKQEADEKKRARKLTAGKVKKQWAPFAGDNGLWKLKDSEAKSVTKSFTTAMSQYGSA